MKKLITLVAASFVAIAAFAQNAQTLPAFTHAENAYVFDAKILKEDYGDYCKVVNLSNEENLAFDVYIMKSNKKEWLLAGSAKVKGILDTDTLNSEYNGKFGRYRYFALVPKDNREYKVQFSYDEIDMYVVEHHFSAFLVDVAEDTPEDIRANSTIIDVDSLKGKFKDNIKFETKSSDENIDFIVYGFDSADATKWEAVGKAHLNGRDDTDSMETPLHDVDVKKFKYYGVYNTKGKKYEIKASKAHNDLILEIQ